MAKIAVDVQVSKQAVEWLERSGHKVVVCAKHGQSDRDWVSKACQLGAEFFVSPDYDIPGLLDKLNYHGKWLKLPQGLVGAGQFNWIEKKMAKKLKPKVTQNMRVIEEGSFIYIVPEFCLGNFTLQTTKADKLKNCLFRIKGEGVIRGGLAPG